MDAVRHRRPALGLAGRGGCTPCTLSDGVALPARGGDLTHYVRRAVSRCVAVTLTHRLVAGIGAAKSSGFTSMPTGACAPHTSKAERSVDATLASRPRGSAHVSDLDTTIREVLEAHGRLSSRAATLNDDDDLYQRGLSSHASVNVMLALEDAFDVEFPDSLLRRDTFRSVGGDPRCARVPGRRRCHRARDVARSVVDRRRRDVRGVHA